MLQASTKILQLFPRKENAIQAQFSVVEAMEQGSCAYAMICVVCYTNDHCYMLWGWSMNSSTHVGIPGTVDLPSVVMPTGCSCFLCYVLRHCMFILILSWFPWVLSCHPLPVTMETVLPLPPIGPVHLVQQDCKNGGFLLHHNSPHPCLPGKSAKSTSLGEVKL